MITSPLIPGVIHQASLSVFNEASFQQGRTMNNKVILALAGTATLVCLSACSSASGGTSDPGGTPGVAAAQAASPSASPTAPPSFKIGCKIVNVPGSDAPPTSPGQAAEITLTDTGSYAWQLPGTDDGDPDSGPFLTFNVTYLNASGAEVMNDGGWEPDNVSSNGTMIKPGQTIVLKELYNGDMTEDSDVSGQGVTSCTATAGNLIGPGEG